MTMDMICTVLGDWGDQQWVFFDAIVLER